MGGRMQQSFVVRAKATTMLRVHPHPVNNFKRTTQDQGRSSRQHITFNKCRWLSQRVSHHCLFCIFVKPFKRGDGKAGLQSNCRTVFHFFFAGWTVSDTYTDVPGMTGSTVWLKGSSADRVRRTVMSGTVPRWFYSISIFECSSASMNLYDLPSASP